MFKRTKMLKNGSITVSIKISMTGYCIVVSGIVGENYSRRHMAVDAANVILNAA